MKRNDFPAFEVIVETIREPLLVLEAKIEYSKTIESLQHKQDDARTKLNELKTAGDEAWEDLKTGAEKDREEIKTAFHEATSRFK